MNKNVAKRIDDQFDKSSDALCEAMEMLDSAEFDPDSHKKILDACITALDRLIIASRELDEAVFGKKAADE